MQIKGDDTQASLLPDFQLDDARKNVQTSIGFRFHFFGAILLVALSLVAWTFAEFKINVFPFWIVLAGFFSVTLAIHFYLFLCPERQWLQLHFALFVSLNLCLFFAWLFSPLAGGLLPGQDIWFVYPLFIWTNFLVVHYCWKVFQRETHRLIWTHVCLFWSLNLMNLFINIAAEATFPWFPIVFFALGIPLIFHWTHHWDPGHWFLLHARLFANTNLMFFVIWAATTRTQEFPWFLVLLIIWGVGLYLHWKFHTAPDKESENAVPYDPPHDDEEFIGANRANLWNAPERSVDPPTSETSVPKPSFSIQEQDD